MQPKLLSDGIRIGNYPIDLTCPFYPLPCIEYQCFKNGHDNIIKSGLYNHRFPGSHITDYEKDIIKSGTPLSSSWRDAFAKYSSIQQEVIIEYYGYGNDNFDKVIFYGRYCSKCNIYNEYQTEAFTCYKCKNGL